MERTQEYTFFEKVWKIHTKFRGVPVSVKYGEWNGFEIRIVDGKSRWLSPISVELNINDTEFCEELTGLFRHVDRSLVETLNRVSFNERFTFVSFMDTQSSELMKKRWVRFNEWLERHVLTEDGDCAVETKQLAENMTAWAARVILGGIAPSEEGKRLLREGKCEIAPTGHLTLKKSSGLVTRWHFAEGVKGVPSAIDSFGVSGAVSAAFSKSCNGDGIIRNNKVPELWEVQANVYIGLEEMKKGMKRFK